MHRWLDVAVAMAKTTVAAAILKRPVHARHNRIYREQPNRFVWNDSCGGHTATTSTHNSNKSEIFIKQKHTQQTSNLVFLWNYHKYTGLMVDTLIPLICLPVFHSLSTATSVRLVRAGSTMFGEYIYSKAFATKTEDNNNKKNTQKKTKEKR